MGLPVNKLICASNENNVLYDFIKLEHMIEIIHSINTIPSMDMTISSNLERLIYHLSKMIANIKHLILN